VGSAQLAQPGGVAEILTADIQVNLPDVFIGLLIGGAVPFLFSSFAIRAVSPARRPARGGSAPASPRSGHLGVHRRVGEKGKPDYAPLAWAISTAAAQRELARPGPARRLRADPGRVLARPLRAPAVPRRCILVGQLMAVFMSNTGGAWDKREEEDRRRLPRRQGQRGAQGGRDRRHRRRPTQGHGPAPRSTR